MAYTMQQIVDRARSRINDQYKQSYDDSELNDLLNEAVKVIYEKRPDFFVGAYATSPPTDKLLTESYPLPDETIQHVINYIVSLAEVQPKEGAGRTGAEERFLRGLYGN